LLFGEQPQLRREFVEPMPTLADAYRCSVAAFCHLERLHAVSPPLVDDVEQVEVRSS
jgi:hypothetical protein